MSDSVLRGKTIVLGVTGSIAAYKIAGLASMLVKAGADVFVIMTENASNFINPITFETLTGHRCMMDTFDREAEFPVSHISLAGKADLVMIAPASANVIGKIAHGIADDMITTTVMACTCKVILSPAMNVHMYQNPILQANLDILRGFGYEVIEPAEGHLACGDTGAGKMPEPETLFEYILKETACEKDMKGIRLMVTAGPTREALDPVRFITNHSSGKMGYAIARQAMLRGAEVTLVSGPVSLPPVPFVKTVPVLSAEDMFRAVTGDFSNQDILIKAAAVADYRPAIVSEDKVKKKEGDMSIPLERTRDILAWIADHRRDEQIVCGFSMETRDMLVNSRKKLKKKKLDLIVANNLKEEGAGFATDTNRVTIISESEEASLGLLSKEDVADQILDRILLLREQRVFGSGRPDGP